MIRSIFALFIAPLFLAVAKKKMARVKRAGVIARRSGQKSNQTKRKGKQTRSAASGKKNASPRGEAAEQVAEPAPPAPPPPAPIQAPTLFSPGAGESTETLTPSFRWFYVGAASHYQLVWSPDVHFHKAHILLTNQTAASLPPEQALTPDTTYSWRVRGGNEGGWGPWSATRSFTTPIE